MLEIQNQPQVKVRQVVNFKGHDEYHPPLSYPSDTFDRDSIDAERDEKLNQIDEQKRQFEELADELENSDSKLVKKTSKGVRFIASALGIAAAFVAAKYSSKVAIETLKTMSKNPTVQKAIESVKVVKEPAMKVYESAKNAVKTVIAKPAVQETINKLKTSKAVKTLETIAKNEKVAKVLEPLKNTLNSVKNVKINGATVQSFVENTMAATTAGSVLVDNITGRNNDKSTFEVATGV